MVLPKWMMVTLGASVVALGFYFYPPATYVILFEIIDLLAIANIHLGNYFKIKRKSIGWALSAMSIVYFIGRSLSTGFVSQCVGHIISLCLAIYGFFAWKIDERKKEIESTFEAYPMEPPDAFYNAGVLYRIWKHEESLTQDYETITYFRDHKPKITGV